MLKVFEPSGWDFGVPIAEMVKVASRGLLGDDMRKLAERSSPRIAYEFKQAMIKAGEVPIHVLALGATEWTNCNRNGDGFPVAACRKYHDTFCKCAKWYRSHKSNDPKQSYGRVIRSFYNDDMGRVELFVGLNGTKEAADRNGGKIADKELEDLESDKTIDVSMGCSVPNDVCSSCSNKAKSRREYCTADMCKHGGLRDNIGRLFDDGHHLHAINDHPRFFDISKVMRRADRVAMVLGRLDNNKYASASGASGIDMALAWNLEMPDWVVSQHTKQAAGSTVRQLEELAKLAALEHNKLAVGLDVAAAYAIQYTPQMPVVADSQVKLAEVLGALSRKNCMLPLPAFISLLDDQQYDVQQLSAAVGRSLPGIFSKLAADPRCEDILAGNPYVPGDTNASYCKWASDQQKYWSISRNVLAANSRLGTIKHASVAAGVTLNTEAVESIAMEYAKYQLGFLQSVPPDNADKALTRRYVISHNYSWC